MRHRTTLLWRRQPFSGHAQGHTVWLCQAQSSTLRCEELLDTTAGQRQRLEEALLGKGVSFGCALDLDQRSAASHDNI